MLYCLHTCISYIFPASLKKKKVIPLQLGYLYVEATLHVVKLFQSYFYCWLKTLNYMNLGAESIMIFCKAVAPGFAELTWVNQLRWTGGVWVKYRVLM